MKEPCDLALLTAWRHGDRAAGNVLLERYFGPLWRFFSNKAHTDADELIQRTLLACAESHQRIRDESSFRTYLFTIARHELYRYFRERRQSWAMDFSVSRLVDVQTSATQRVQRREGAAALEAALKQLPLDDQLLLELFYGEELDSRALSEVFEIEPSSVRARLHRARKHLARLLRDG